MPFFPKHEGECEHETNQETKTVNPKMVQLSSMSHTTRGAPVELLVSKKAEKFLKYLSANKEPDMCLHLNKCTCVRFIQLPFAKPELRSMDSAGVELQPEHSVPVSSLGAPVVALDLQRAAEKREQRQLQLYG